MSDCISVVAFIVWCGRVYVCRRLLVGSVLFVVCKSWDVGVGCFLLCFDGNINDKEEKEYFLCVCGLDGGHVSLYIF